MIRLLKNAGRNAGVNPTFFAIKIKQKSGVIIVSPTRELMTAILNGFANSSRV